MRTLVLTLLLTVLTVLFVVGCSEDPVKPRITRMYANETCGVAPLAVSFRVDATGGVAEDQPTGSNNWLTIEWDFGDGSGANANTAVAYHVYEDPGFYTVICKVTDADGESDLDSLHVEARSDTLTIAMLGRIDGEPITEVEVCRPFQLDITGSACGFDAETGNQDRFVFNWTVGDSTYAGVGPYHTFHPSVLDDDDAVEEMSVEIFDPVLDIHRSSSTTLTALPSDGADLSVEVDWSNSALEPTAEDTLVRAVSQFPDVITYTVTLHNDGLASGYNIRIDGELPTEDAEGQSDIRMVHLDGDAGAGTYQYYPPSDSDGDGSIDTDAFWTWFLPEIPAGASASLDVRVMFEAADKFDLYSFPLSIQEYWCDASADDNDAEAVYELSSAPSDIRLQASWGSTPGGGLDPVIFRAVPAGNDVPSSFPDQVGYTMSVLNDGPSDAFELTVTGTLPDDPAISYAGNQAPLDTDFEYDAPSRTWTWTIPRAAAATNATILVDIDQLPLDTSFDFPASIAVYPEDPTPEDHDAVATYMVYNSISELDLSTTWQDAEGNDLAAGDLEHDVLNFPDRLVLHHDFTNNGPYLARGLSLQGNLGVTTDAYRILLDATDFDFTASNGNLVVDTETGEWVWIMDELAVGATVTLDISFDLNQSIEPTDAGNWYNFYSTLDYFPGDYTDDNNAVTSRLAIRSLPEK